MSKPIIHFSHANGFPAETYRKMFHYLQPDFKIGYINIHAHHPDYPVTDNWEMLVYELINYIEKNYHAPVMGVGHSLGGVLTFAAAALRPDLFKCIILLDAPVLGTVRSVLIRLMKKVGMVDKVTPGHRSKFRRTQWGSVEEAIDYFRSKHLFRYFDEECLEDYVQFGTEKTKAGIQLKFDRSIEYQIYCTLPHNLSKYKGRLNVPAALIYGKYSYAIKSYDRRNMKKYYNIRSVPIEAGHLFPFEQPELAALMIKRTISELIVTDAQ